MSMWNATGNTQGFSVLKNVGGMLVAFCVLTENDFTLSLPPSIRVNNLLKRVKGLQTFHLHFQMHFIPSNLTTHIHRYRPVTDTGGG